MAFSLTAKSGGLSCTCPPRTPGPTANRWVNTSNTAASIEESSSPFAARWRPCSAWASSPRHGSRERSRPRSVPPSSGCSCRSAPAASRACCAPLSPTIGDLVLDVVSLDYQHTLMAGAGAAVEKAMTDSMAKNKGEYLLVVTGSIPTNDGGIYCTIGGRTAQSILEEAAKGAAAIIAIGACAHWGSVQAARPNPTGAVGVGEHHQGQADREHRRLSADRRRGHRDDRALPDVQPAARRSTTTGGRCSPTATRIHDQCPRRAHFDAGQFVEAFDDEAARKGWCLYHVGCKGPATFSPVPDLPVEHAAPAGRSAPGIRASAAPSRTSGTR